MIIEWRWLFLHVLKQYEGITLFPFVFVFDKHDKFLIRHELCHIRQCARYFIVGFYAAYVFQYLRNRFRGMNHDNAYYMISFEIQAREAEGHE